MSALRTCPECGAAGDRVTTMGGDILGGPDPNVITCTAGHQYPVDPAHPRWARFKSATAPVNFTLTPGWWNA